MGVNGGRVRGGGGGRGGRAGVVGSHGGGGAATRARVCAACGAGLSGAALYRRPQLRTVLPGRHRPPSSAWHLPWARGMAPPQRGGG